MFKIVKDFKKQRFIIVKWYFNFWVVWETGDILSSPIESVANFEI